MRAPSGHNSFSNSVNISDIGLNFAIWPTFDSTNHTLPSGATLIASGCVHKVGISYSFTNDVDFASPPVPQKVARCSSGKLSIGVPVFVICTSSSVISIGGGGGSANNTVDVNRIPPKNANARYPFVFCFTIFQN